MTFWLNPQYDLNSENLVLLWSSEERCALIQLSVEMLSQASTIVIV